MQHYNPAEQKLQLHHYTNHRIHILVLVSFKNYLQKGKRAYERKDCYKGNCLSAFNTTDLKNLPLTEKSTEFTPNIILSLL